MLEFNTTTLPNVGSAANFIEASGCCAVLLAARWAMTAAPDAPMMLARLRLTCRRAAYLPARRIWVKSKRYLAVLRNCSPEKPEPGGAASLAFVGYFP
jgi:hypothetical protein